MPKNTRAKRRDVENPYSTFFYGDAEYRVLKHYQTAENERKNEFARVLVAVRSPLTYNEWEYGDEYTNFMPGYNRYWDREDEDKGA